jgi:hypothetical protein
VEIVQRAFIRPPKTIRSDKSNKNNTVKDCCNFSVQYYLAVKTDQPTHTNRCSDMELSCSEDSKSPQLATTHFIHVPNLPTDSFRMLANNTSISAFLQYEFQPGCYQQLL